MIHYKALLRSHQTEEWLQQNITKYLWNTGRRMTKYFGIHKTLVGIKFQNTLKQVLHTEALVSTSDKNDNAFIHGSTGRYTNINAWNDPKSEGTIQENVHKFQNK